MRRALAITWLSLLCLAIGAAIYVAWPFILYTIIGACAFGVAWAAYAITLKAYRSVFEREP